MTEKLYQQIECWELLPFNIAGDRYTGAQLVVWAESGVPLNAIVRFKETGDVRWRVKKVYGTPQQLQDHRAWGLNLPKSQRTER